MSNEVHLRDRESQASFIKDQKEDTRDYTLMSLADITQEAEGSCTKEEKICHEPGTSIQETGTGQHGAITAGQGKLLRFRVKSLTLGKLSYFQ